jgi:hypothetical protein
MGTHRGDEQQGPLVCIMCLLHGNDSLSFFLCVGVVHLEFRLRPSVPWSDFDLDVRIIYTHIEID